MFRTDEYMHFESISSQYNQQVTNRSHVITNNTSHRRSFGELRITKYKRESMGRMPIHFYRFNCGICCSIWFCKEYKIKTLLHMDMY